MYLITNINSLLNVNSYPFVLLSYLFSLTKYISISVILERSILHSIILKYKQNLDVWLGWGFANIRTPIQHHISLIL